MMEHRASESDKEQSQMEITIKTEVEVAATYTAHIDSKIDLNHSKQEPGLVHPVKSEPTLLMEDDILDDSSQDGNEQQCVPGTSTPASTGSVILGDSLNVKRELEDMDIGPTVLQHMDIHYTINKNGSAVTEENTTVDDCKEAIPSNLVKKESIENELRGSPTSQMVTINKQSARCVSHSLLLTVHKDHLVSICRVNLMRLNTFRCELCDVVYAEKCWLLQHLQSVHRYLFMKFRKTNRLLHAADSKTKPCKYCGQMKTEEDNKVHLESCHGQQKDLRHHRGTSSGGFKCDACERTFRTSHWLVKHIKLHQRNKSMTSVMTSACENLMRVHASQKPYKCDTCYASFKSRSHLSRHLGIHTGEKPYQCKMCDARFLQGGGLTMHMRVHTGEKPYQCDMCLARFSKNIQLIHHIRVHTGEKPYQCNKCVARFARSRDLNLHIRIHTGEKPYQCDTCNARFRQRVHLTEHMRVHTGEKLFACSECKTKFAYKNNLKRHMKHQHTKKKQN